MNELESATSLSFEPTLLANDAKIEFVGRCDEVTFGVADGLPFHNGDQKQWPPADQIQWARSNAAYLSHAAARLLLFANAVEAQAVKGQKA